MDRAKLIGATALTVAVTILLTLAFTFSVDAAAWSFGKIPYAALALPVAGLLTFALYRLLKVPFDMGTGTVIRLLRAESDCEKTPDQDGEQKLVPVAVAPAIFIGTCLTIVAGGSAGKEAGALQIGAAVAAGFARLFKIGKDHLMVLVSCAMGSALSVLLGTPIAATLLAIELLRFWRCSVLDFVVVLASSVLSSYVAACAGCHSLSAQLAPLVLTAPNLGAALLVVLGSAAAGLLFCWGIVYGRKAIRRLPGPAWVPVLVSGVVVAVVLLLVPGGCAWSGTGMAQVDMALAGAITDPYFAGKILMTVALLGCGFKGGEIMPTLCIGATCGAFVGSLAGIDPCFSAALGLVSALSVCANAPLASCLMGIEAFGLAAGGWFAVAALVGFVLTLRWSLYGNTYSYKELVRKIRPRA